MTLRLLALVFALLLAPMPAVAADSAVRTYTIEQLMAADSFGRLSFSPDNSKLLTTSNRTGIANIYVVPVDGGPLQRLTESTVETVSAIGYFPRDERILYSSDQGGNELAHLYVRELDGSVRDVTPGERHVARFVDWAHDGRSFFVQMNDRDPRFFDLYEISADGYERTKLFENDRAYQIRAVSPDRRYVALSRIHDNATKPCYVYDRQDRQLRQLTAAGPVACEPQAFAATGSVLFYTTDDGGEFTFLVRQDLATGERTTVFRPERWDVSGATLSSDNRYLVVSVNEDARGRPYLFDAATLRPVPFENPAPQASVGLLLANGAPLAAVSVSSGNTPGDVYVQDLGTGERRLLLRAQAPEVDPADLVNGEVVRFRSYDGVEVPGVLYLPHGAHPGERRPAVIHVHGGPGDESRIGYRPLVQYLVNHGYVVFEINNRGSSGSGRSFYHMDDRRHGSADLDDVVAAKRWLGETGHVDVDRVAIQGQSYGGYMALAGLTFRPEEFAVGVDIYGVSNWLRLLQNTPSWWEDLRRLLFTEVGDPERDADYLRSISPVFHAERIRRPLLVLQGQNDPRVLPVESEDIVARVRANDVPVDYVVFPDEGHGFRKKANQITAYRTILQFLDRHLRGGAETARAE
ncbi:S9 family peptidase [Sphingosinicella terrae]|uniref:S9 family peptidase n=1 Tax=Sphingosinicella terrae TaxID=2172047 RepID=UPI000E0D74C6|nr:S9 family peptidase [Sphingosinicella terrae]